MQRRDSGGPRPLHTDGRDVRQKPLDQPNVDLPGGALVRQQTVPINRERVRARFDEEGHRLPLPEVTGLVKERPLVRLALIATAPGWPCEP